MRHMLRCGALTLTLGLLAIAFATGQNPPGKPGDNAPLPQTGEISGKLAMAGGSSRTLTVLVEVQVYEPNPTAARGANQQQQNLMRQQYEIQRRQAELMRARNPREQMQRMHQLQQQMARLQLEMARAGMNPQRSPFKAVTKRQDYDIGTDENTKIRFKDPPVAYDEKGNPKKYTPAELKELQGNDPRAPGYKGDFDQLRPGHLVRIVLGKKPAAKPGKDLDKEEQTDEKAYATLVLVVGEDAPPPQPKKK